jgi:hypothetical protein
MRPDESLFKKHLEEAVFLTGVADSQWGLVGSAEEIIWPHVLLWCKATPPEGTGSSKYYFRFNLEGYSEQAPTALPWDVSKNQPLAIEVWPGWSEQLRKVFNPKWNNGIALYAPCDRIAIPGHAQWKEKHPTDFWTPGSTIIKYLRFLLKILNDYEN